MKRLIIAAVGLALLAGIMVGCGGGQQKVKTLDGRSLTTDELISRLISQFAYVANEDRLGLKPDENPMNPTKKDMQELLNLCDGSIREMKGQRALLIGQACDAATSGDYSGAQGLLSDARHY